MHGSKQSKSMLEMNSHNVGELPAPGLIHAKGIPLAIHRFSPRVSIRDSSLRRDSCFDS